MLSQLLSSTFEIVYPINKGAFDGESLIEAGIDLATWLDE